MFSDALFWAGLEPRGGHAAGPVVRRRPHARHPNVGPPLRHVPAEDPGEPHQVGSPHLHHRSEAFPLVVSIPMNVEWIGLNRGVCFQGCPGHGLELGGP